MSQIGISRGRTGVFPRADRDLRALSPGFSFPRERAAIMGVALGCALSLFDIALYLFDGPAHHRFNVEDGFVENLTVVFWLLGAVYILATLHLRKGWGLHLLLATAMIFMAGEELSWGQRLFSFATPASLDAINEQHEFNLHNIAGIHESIKNIGLLSILAGTVLLPVLARISASAGQLAARFAVPFARLDVIALVLVATLLRIASRTIWHIYYEGDVFDEMSEMVLGLAFFLLALDRTPMKK